jgi:hypothetical protein
VSVPGARDGENQSQESPLPPQQQQMTMMISISHRHPLFPQPPKKLFEQDM